MGCGTSQENLKTVTLPQANKNQKKEMIGVGHHGRVYKIYNNNDSKYYAQKIIDNFNSSIDRKLLQQPVKKMQNLKHQNIATMHSFEYTNKEISIVMELVQKQSTLKKYIQRNGAIPQQTASNYIQEVMQGLKYLHESSILHGDLKPSNILMTPQGKLKLSDYSLAQLYDHRLTTNKKSPPKQQIVFYRGDSLPYMAPQTIKDIQFNHYSDIWSLGCVLIEMLTAKIPWSDLADKFQDAFIVISSQAVPPLPLTLSKDCLSFLQACLAVVPTQRSSLNELLHHKFIRKHSKNSALFFEQQASLDNIRVTLQNSDQLNRAHKKPVKGKLQASPTQQSRPIKQRKQNSRLQSSRQNFTRKDMLSLQIDNNIIKIRDALHSIDSRLQARRSRESHYEEPKPLQENLHTVIINNKKVSLDPQKYKMQPASTKFKTEESEWISPPREKNGNKYSVQIEKSVQVGNRVEDDAFSRKSPNFEDSLDTVIKFNNARIETEPNFSDVTDKQYFKRPLKLLKKKLKESKQGHDFHRKLTSQTSKDPSIRIQQPQQLHQDQISASIAHTDIHSRSQQPMEKDRYSGRLRILTQTRDERIIDTQLARAERDRFMKQQKVLRKLREEQKERWEEQLKKGAEILKKEFKSHYFHDLKDPQQLIMSRL